MPEPIRAKKRKIIPKIDYAKLRTLLEEKYSADDIMHEFRLKSKATLRNAVMRLSMQDRKIYDIEGLFVRGVAGELRYGKFGVRLSPSILEKFKEGDRFTVEVKENEIILKKI